MLGVLEKNGDLSFTLRIAWMTYVALIMLESWLEPKRKIRLMPALDCYLNMGAVMCGLRNAVFLGELEMTERQKVCLRLVLIMMGRNSMDLRPNNETRIVKHMALMRSPCCLTLHVGLEGSRWMIGSIPLLCMKQKAGLLSRISRFKKQAALLRCLLIFLVGPQS